VTYLFLFLTILSEAQFSTLITSIVTILVTLITYIIAPYAIEHAKKYISKPNEIDAIRQELNIKKPVHDKLESIKTIVNCDKIWIANFHNGGNYLNSARSMKKFTMNYEICNADIVKTSDYFKETHIHLYYKFISKIFESSHLFIDFLNMESQRYELDVLDKFYPIKTAYVFPIYSIDDKILGMMAIEFINEHKVLERNQLEYILGDVGSIGAHLS